jgi:DNA-binding NarL/FixJ family response regulator
MSIQISVVGDNPAAVQMFGPLLKGTSRTRRLNIYRTGEEALRDIPLQPPDIVLIDFCLPCMNGLECVGKLRRQMPALPVLMYGTESENDGTFPALYAGASGYMPKDLPARELIMAITRVHRSMRSNRKIFLTFFRPARRLADPARYLSKMAELLDADKAVVDFEHDWRRVVVTGKTSSDPVGRLAGRRLVTGPMMAGLPGLLTPG